MSIHVLPDTRAHSAKGIFRGPDGRNYQPIFCANCGCPKGAVPEEMCTFAFALCDPCAEKYGHPAHLHVEPDQVFLDRVNEELAAQKIDVAADPMALIRAMSDESNPFFKLAKDWQRHLRSHS